MARIARDLYVDSEPHEAMVYVKTVRCILSNLPSRFHHSSIALRHLAGARVAKRPGGGAERIPLEPADDGAQPRPKDPTPPLTSTTARASAHEPSPRRDPSQVLDIDWRKFDALKDFRE